MLTNVPPTPVQSTHDLDVAVQPNVDVQMQPHPSYDITPTEFQPPPRTGEPPSRRRRSSDLRIRLHELRTKSCDSNMLQCDSDVIASSQVPTTPTSANFNWDKHVAPILNTMSGV